MNAGRITPLVTRNWPPDPREIEPPVCTNVTPLQTAATARREGIGSATRDPAGLGSLSRPAANHPPPALQLFGVISAPFRRLPSAALAPSPGSRLQNVKLITARRRLRETGSVPSYVGTPGLSAVCLARRALMPVEVILCAGNGH